MAEPDPQHFEPDNMDNDSEDTPHRLSSFTEEGIDSVPEFELEEEEANEEENGPVKPRVINQVETELA